MKTDRTQLSRWLPVGVVCVVGIAVIAVLIVGSPGSHGSSTPGLYQGPVVVPRTAAGGWRPGGKGVALADERSPTGAVATTFTLGAERNSYTFAKRSFFPSLNWGANQWLFVEWKGNASGLPLQLFVDTDPTGKHAAQFSFVDTTAGWTTLSFDLDHPSTVFGKLDLGHVYRVRLATVLKDAKGTFTVGRLTLSQS